MKAPIRIVFRLIQGYTLSTAANCATGPLTRSYYCGDPGAPGRHPPAAFCPAHTGFNSGSALDLTRAARMTALAGNLGCFARSFAIRAAVVTSFSRLTTAGGVSAFFILCHISSIPWTRFCTRTVSSFLWKPPERRGWESTRVTGRACAARLDWQTTNNI